MTLRESLLAELDAEAPFVRESLSRVPLDKGDWKPHDKSMPLSWLATFLCVMWSWGVITVEHAEFDPKAQAGSGQRPEAPKTTAAMLKLFDDNIGAFRSALAKTSEENLLTSFRLLSGGELFFDQPKWKVLQTFIINHAVHHRAQLGVYLRLLGIAVPAIYNDSADDKGGMFR